MKRISKKLKEKTIHFIIDQQAKFFRLYPRTEYKTHGYLSDLDFDTTVWDMEETFDFLFRNYNRVTNGLKALEDIYAS